MSRKNLRKLDLDPVDPLVKVPAAVQRSMAAADEAHAAMYGETTISDAESPTEPTDADQQPDDQEGTPAAEAPLERAPPPAEGDPWEHRYRSLRGRFDTQSTALQSQERRINQLEGLIASIQSAPEHNQPQHQQRLITPEEERDYGVDFLDVVAKKAREDLSPEINALNGRIERIASRMEVDEEARLEQAQQQLWGYLDAALPEWQDINAHPAFLEWLALPDEYSGGIRQTLIANAFEAHDAPRVLRFFNGFLAEEAAAGNPSGFGSEPPQAPAVPSNGNGGQRQSRVSLERLAAPGRARSGASATAPSSEKPLISTAQISRFYADVAANRYRGREAEKNSLEAMIFEAQRDGRITR